MMVLGVIRDIVTCCFQILLLKKIKYMLDILSFLLFMEIDTFSKALNDSSKQYLVIYNTEI